MNRRRADTVVGILLGVVLLIGGAASWQAYRQRRAIDQSMGTMMDMGAMHGPNPLWYVGGTVLVAGGIGVAYAMMRGEFTDSAEADSPERPDQTSPAVSTSTDAAASPETSKAPESTPQARVLDIVPDDERRILEPVLNSPGITQIELRDRSEFSKSKVSQTVSSLEERGLLYRERQGRTYRVYPSDELRQ